MADQWQKLVQVPLERIRLVPPPGTATEQDVLDAHDHAGRICELVDGVLVEKTVGLIESVLAMAIGEFLHRFVREGKLGIVLGGAGPLEILPGQVRHSRCLFRELGKIPRRQAAEDTHPRPRADLAVEVLSESNSEGEMRRKLQDYFAAGVRLVWYIDPRTRTATTYTSPQDFAVLGENDSLTGGDVLPGFELPLRNCLRRLTESEGGCEFKTFVGCVKRTTGSGWCVSRTLQIAAGPLGSHKHGKPILRFFRRGERIEHLAAQINQLLGVGKRLFDGKLSRRQSKYLPFPGEKKVAVSVPIGPVGPPQRSASIQMIVDRIFRDLPGAARFACFEIDLLESPWHIGVWQCLLQNPRNLLRNS